MISFLIDGRSQKRQRVAIGSMIVRTIIVVAVQMTRFRSIIIVLTLIKSKSPCVCGRSHQSRIAMKRTDRLLRSMTHRSSRRRRTINNMTMIMTARRRYTAPSSAIPRRRSHGIVMKLVVDLTWFDRDGIKSK